jgi:small nuclear ribonucleoprotein (snRNP)-like protein
MVGFRFVFPEFGVARGDSGIVHKDKRGNDMQKGLRQINVNGFLGKNVEVTLYDGSRILGKLLGVDRSSHGFMGNLTLRYNGGLNVIRGDSVRSIAPAAKIWVSEPIYSQVESVAKENGVDVDELANGILELALDRVKNGLMEVTKP